jgi:hypothetical protein
MSPKKQVQTGPIWFAKEGKHWLWPKKRLKITRTKKEKKNLRKGKNMENNIYLKLALQKKWAVVWIQNSREPVWGRGQMQGQACPTLGKESVGTQQRWGKQQETGEEHIQDVMQENQRLTEWEDYLFTVCHHNKWLVNLYHFVTIIFSFRGINHLVLRHLHCLSVNTQAEYLVLNRNIEKSTDKRLIIRYRQ